MDRGRWKRGVVSHGMLSLLALHPVNEYYRLPWKPPVTAGLLAANTLIFLRPSFLDSLLPFVDEVWFNPHLILKLEEFRKKKAVEKPIRQHIPPKPMFLMLA
ncbi:hypothetical protein ERO13_A01G135700v2 [Gossypium hirsutum]|uniref:Rhomboid-like protein 14, mitochondrial n=3 Tax=Gossypium TaxID=3633 RepID=A0A1U8KLK4_GOSHI|nr:rhomboid-like protein 14, mitochondrial [Gossypium hirsutum]KAB2096969.1 hypothetical protein ES319_A01G139400v1 [Gossypium barbadense]KAG4214689.1 hypothetical protein ERO13_A01G135700v2 [Gossypium hirsutum]TYI43287.1 hypothetical protein ES332_A01G157900v1 [Gossypium tomentosum]